MTAAGSRSRAIARVGVTKRRLHPFNAQNGDIYVMRPDGSDVRMLTDDTFEKATPGFLR